MGAKRENRGGARRSGRQAQMTAPEPRAKSSAPPRGYVSLGPFADPSANVPQTRTANPATMSAVFGQRDVPRRRARMNTIANTAPSKGPNMRESVPMYARSEVSEAIHSAWSLQAETRRPDTATAATSVRRARRGVNSAMRKSVRGQST